MNLDERARRAAASTREQAERVDTDAILARVQRSRRGRWLAPVGAVAAAAALVATAVLILPGLGSDRVEIMPGPPDAAGSSSAEEPADPDASSPGETDSPTGSGAHVWQRVEADAFVGSGEDQMRRAVHAGGTVVAVGASSDGAGIWRHDPQRPAQDPSAWQQVGTDLCGEASCEVNDVVLFGEQLVAVGSLDGLPKAWTSDDDGENWQRVDIEVGQGQQAGGPTALTAIAVRGDGQLVAFGSQQAGEAVAAPFALTSTDGRAWTEATVDFEDEEAGAEFIDAETAADGQVLAVGYIGDGTVLWAESDGVWAARHLSEADPTFGVVTTFATSLTQGADGELLLTGSVHGGQDQDGHVWRSTDDGATWQARPEGLDGTGDQQVTGLFHDGDALVAVGWTSDDPQDGEAFPAAWRQEDDRWQPTEGGHAFEEPGVIRAAVAVDGHSAVAVGSAGGSGYEADRGDERTDAAVWTYGAGAPPAQDPTAVPGSGGCSASDAASEPAAQPELPERVSEMRLAVHEAAVQCDLEELAELALAGSRDFTYSFGEGDDPASHWQRREGEGDEPLLTLSRVLDLPHATIETQFEADRYETVHVWPSAFADDATDADWDAVVDAGLVTAAEAQRMREEFGGYLGHRVGITSDGEWVFFVAGD